MASRHRRSRRLPQPWSKGLRRYLIVHRFKAAQGLVGTLALSGRGVAAVAGAAGPRARAPRRCGSAACSWPSRTSAAATRRFATAWWQRPGRAWRRRPRIRCRLWSTSPPARGRAAAGADRPDHAGDRRAGGRPAERRGGRPRGPAADQRQGAGRGGGGRAGPHDRGRDRQRRRPARRGPGAAAASARHRGAGAGHADLAAQRGRDPGSRRAAGDRGGDRRSRHEPARHRGAEPAPGAADAGVPALCRSARAAGAGRARGGPRADAPSADGADRARMAGPERAAQHADAGRPGDRGCAPSC